MLTIRNNLEKNFISLPVTAPFTDYLEPEILFFDLETTGFTAKNSYLYLIGCLYIDEGIPVIIQWFAHDLSQEQQILLAFLEFIKNYKLLVQFNGTTFDLPYLRQKVDYYQLVHTFGQMEHLDLYKEFTPLKKLLGLKSIKQKALETFLSVERKDPYTGGELIPIYVQYLGKYRYESLRSKLHSDTYKEFCISANSGLPFLPELTLEELKGKLLLHNFEDIKNLAMITSLYAYISILKCQFTILDLSAASEIHPVTKHFIPGYCFQLQLTIMVPKTVTSTISYPEFFIIIRVMDKHAVIFIPCFEGELKHFYKDYKDYYYLPAEDTAIHKNVAEYVDKSFREKAKAANCYTRRTGIFLPQAKDSLQPVFYKSYKETPGFFEVTPDFLTDATMQKDYIMDLFSNKFT